MAITNHALCLALTGAALAVSASSADAKPRRVVVLDFDGPRGLADEGTTTVVELLDDSYDLVASKRWIDAKAAASRRDHGPKAWSKAARTAGVDAVVEGWINDEGRAKVLTIVVTDASTGKALDQLTLRLPAKGFTRATERKLLDGIEERFEWIEPITRASGELYERYEPTTVSVKDKRRFGPRRDAGDRDRDDELDDRRARRDRRARDDDRDDRRRRRDAERDDDDDDVTEKRPTKVATIETTQERETNVLRRVFLPAVEEEDIVTGGKASHVPEPTARFRVAGGFDYESRNLFVGAENPGGVMQYASVPNKALSVDAAFYPFPSEKLDGILSGVGFSFGISKSMGGVVTFVEEEQSTDLPINQHQWHAGIHYRAPLGSSFAIDGEVGYGQWSYQIIDAPETFEVPDTQYSYLTAGGGVDLRITERASVGFGAKYLYTLGTGDLNSTEWYGPGTSSGFRFGGNFVVPLPSRLFVKGELAYTRIKTTFDGIGGPITEDEGVYETVDSNIGGSVKLGIEF
jgi:hypothetical protein